MKNEPAFTAGLIQAFVQTVLALLVSFGFHLSADQTAAILAAVSSFSAVVLALAVRRHVTPTG